MFEQILRPALENKRPNGSPAIQALADALMAIKPEASSQDGIGNVWIDLRIFGTSTCFMAHMDTVHWETGSNRVIWGENVVSTGGTDVLGADDGAGVALLAGLIVAEVPALYIFTQNEERGGAGARYIVEHHARMFRQIDRIISGSSLFQVGNPARVGTLKKLSLPAMR